jgi:hypothetical protein
LHEGHLEEALADIDALYQLVQLNRSEYTLVAQMIRVAIGGLGISVTWEALQAPGWTEPQLEHLQRTWEKLDFLQALETGFLGERAGGAEVFALMRSPKARSLELLLNPRGSGRLPLETRAANAFSDYVWLPFYKVTSIDSDEMFYLNAMQESLSATRLLKQGRTWGEVKHISDSTLAELNATASRRINLRLYISAIAIPNFSRATQTAIRREVERRMAVTAIALERFKLRDGRYPDALEKLKPDFLSAIPMDSMSGKPLAYRLKDDGGLLLYSVGEDGIDNGGDGSWVSGAKTSLFDARDAVWPAAAQSE